ncbi:MAG: hypothetical protein KIH69_003615 [Anaerolineae bacterium]|nr:hypothetical protein [Anaerolineae bacterium]
MRKQSRKQSNDQLALPLPIEPEPDEALEARVDRAEQTARNIEQFEEAQRQAEAEELANQQQRRAKKYGVVAEALQLARRHDENIARALRAYGEGRGGRDIKVSKWWLHKTKQPNADELVHLFKLDERDALHFDDRYWQVVAELVEQTRYTVYTRDEQGFVTGSQMRSSEHRGVYTLATVGLWANLGQDWQSAVADKIEWRWRIRFGRIEAIGDDEKAIVATLKSSGLRAKVEIENDDK